MVTGGSGFIGRHVLHALRDRQVEIYTISRRKFDCPGVNVICADLLSSPISDIIGDVKPNVVLHNAWFVEHGAFWESTLNLDWVGATLRLGRACIEHSVDRFVGVGTCYEYEWPSSAPCIEATTPIGRHLLYDRAKSAVRDLLGEYFSKNHTAFAWGRMFFLYGPYEAPQRLVASIARALLEREPAKCSSGLAVRDFMDVRDAGAALAALALSTMTGDVNISSGIPVRIADVAMLLGELAGTPDLIKLGAYPDRTEPPYIVGCSQRLMQDAMFTPSFDLRSGLQHALDFWRSERALIADAPHAMP